MKYMILAIAAAFSLGCAACEQEGNGNGSGTENGEVEIRVIGLEFGQDPSPLDFNPQRVRTTETGYTTGFTNGDTIGITVVDADGSTILQDNIPYGYNGTVWAPAGSEKILRRTGTGITYFAYYPYDSGNNTKLPAAIKGDFTPKSDQSVSIPGNYTKSDLMAWTSTANPFTSGTSVELNVNLAHQMALVEVTMPSGAAVTKIEVDTVDKTSSMYVAATGVYRYIVKPAATPAGAALNVEYTASAVSYVWQGTTTQTLAPGQCAKVSVSN